MSSTNYALAGVIGASIAVIAFKGLQLDVVVACAAGVAVAALILVFTPQSTTSNASSTSDKGQEKKESKKAKAKSKPQPEAPKQTEQPKKVEEVAQSETKKKKKAQDTPKAVEQPVVEQKQQPSSTKQKQTTPQQQPTQQPSKQQLSQTQSSKAAQPPAKTQSKPEAKQPEAKQPSEKPKEKKEKSQAEKDADEGWEVAKPTKSALRLQEKERNAAVAKAAAAPVKDIASVVEEKETELEMAVGLAKLGVVIGEKGATLKALQDATQTKIDVPKKDSGSSKLVISGPVANVQACKAAIESLLTRGFSSATHPGFVHDEINVDPKFYGTIIGPSGATLKALQKSSGARITMPDRRDDRNHKVFIVGYKEQVHAARAAIKQLVSEGVSELTHEHFLKMEFPSDKKAILIGPKGQTIKSIQGNTRTKINLPDHGDYIIIVGSQENVKKAEREITNLLAPEEDAPAEYDEDSEDNGYIFTSSANAWSAAATASGEDALWE